jgi:hypothetical protein
VEVGPTLSPGPESHVGVQPGGAALHYPAVPAQPGAVSDSAAVDARTDPAGAQQPPVLGVVRATVREQCPRLAAGPTTQPADRRNRVDQGQQLGDVVAVAASEADLQRAAVGVDDQVVLGTWPAAIDGVAPDVVPPLRARTCEPSTARRSRYSAPAAHSSPNSISCTAGHIPASVQSLMRRQHVTPKTPSSCRSSLFQPIPVLSTNTVPANAARSSAGLRPGVLVAPGWAWWQQRLDSLPQRVRNEIPHHAHHGRRGLRQRSRATPNSF